jgi:hypothetical protein
VGGGGLYHGVESLIIVHIGTLGEPLEVPSALYQSRVPLALNLFMKIHLQATTVAPKDCGTMCQVLLDSRVSYSSSIAQLKWGLASALRTEGRVGDSCGKATTEIPAA